MYKELLELKEKSYSPYSNFWVAAIAISNNKKYYGVNIENAAYPATVCAEIIAASNAILDGNKKIEEIHLLTKSENFGMPCGNCRQFLSEFMDVGAVFYIYNKDGRCKTFLIDELLLNRFTIKDLK